ncbi:phosphate transporter (Pho88) [Monosporozyma unispora]|nr:phosphate transporter (Pho88) [Kazachstania unispora]
MNPQITNILIMGGMMIISRFLDFENKIILNVVRIMYFSSMFISLAILQLTKWKIQKNNDLTVLKYVAKDSNSMFNLAAAEVDPTNENSNGERLHVISIKDYDLTEINSALKSLSNNLVVMLFMHLYLKYSNPLFMQCISPIKSTLENKVVQIILFSKKDSGYLKRPFKTEPMFGGDNGKTSGGSMMSMMTGGDIKTDKKTIETYEKAGNGGVKLD